METERLRKFHQACEIINGHFKAIVEELADEVIENEEQFQLGAIGSADEILEKYRMRLYSVEQARCALLRASKQSRQDLEMKNKDVHLKADEFLCLVCRNVIMRSDKECSECGWTWDA